MENSLLDTMVSIHKKMKMLNWWDGEDSFQTIVETVGTQQCKLIEASIWAYDLKLLSDESTGGDMLSVVENELEDWIKSENSNWTKESEIAKKKQDWDDIKIRHIKTNKNRRMSIATRSLWAWYGKNFPMRMYPKFITTKEWSREHKEWLVNNKSEDIIRKLNFNIIASKRKLNDIRDFIVKETNGFFDNMNKNNAIPKLKSIISVGNETAPKIALFYFGMPFVIFDEYLLRVSKRYRWFTDDSSKWNAGNKKEIEDSIFNWLIRCDDETKSKRLKAIHAIINDCGNLYCKKEGSNCKKCPLSKVLNNNEHFNITQTKLFN
jgi:endonuclease III-like uncharacterized protein